MLVSPSPTRPDTTTARPGDMATPADPGPPGRPPGRRGSGHRVVTIALVLAVAVVSAVLVGLTVLGPEPGSDVVTSAGADPAPATRAAPGDTGVSALTASAAARLDLGDGSFEAARDALLAEARRLGIADVTVTGDRPDGGALVVTVGGRTLHPVVDVLHGRLAGFLPDSDAYMAPDAVPALLAATCVDPRDADRSTCDELIAPDSDAAFVQLDDGSWARRLVSLDGRPVAMMPVELGFAVGLDTGSADVHVLHECFQVEDSARRETDPEGCWDTLARAVDGIAP